MRNVGFGRPGTKAFPDNWQGTHAPVIGKVLDCKVKIGPAGQEPTWNPTSGQTETQAVDPVYDGCAGIAPVSTSDGTRVDVVDEQAQLRIYEVTLPVAVAGLQPGHRVLVVESPDAMLTGQMLMVDTIERGDRRFSRVLYATLDETPAEA